MSAGDRLAVVELLHRYAHAVDAQDPDQVVALFTEDGRFSTVDGTVDVRGHAQLHAFYTSALVTGPMSPPARTTHVMANAVVTLSPDTTTATTTLDAIVHRWHPTTPALTLRGLRYTDTVARVGTRWLLSHRTHELRWQGHMPADATPL